MDEIDCGNFFDLIDDFIDFPEDTNESGGLAGGNYDSFPSVWTDTSDAFPVPENALSGDNSYSTSDLSAEFAVPYEDIAHLEWLSTFVEDSFSNTTTFDKHDTFTKNQESSPKQFHISSPISVLESSTSYSIAKKTQPNLEKNSASKKRGRPRTKRGRPTNFTPRPVTQLISPTSSTDSITDQNKTKKKIKLVIPLRDDSNNENPQPQLVRKCKHCGITKTPQWRAGPMGPKTLCNACGVRHKSGRLFPEYRPAASPTFVPSLHSNSHKKVVEMRSKVCEKLEMD